MKVFVKFISLVCFRVCLEVNVAKTLIFVDSVLIKIRLSANLCILLYFSGKYNNIRINKGVNNLKKMSVYDKQLNYDLQVVYTETIMQDFYENELRTLYPNKERYEIKIQNVETDKKREEVYRKLGL